MKIFHKLNVVLESSVIQRLLLAILIVFVFWDGLWGGAPRADQIHYLHKISQYSSLWDILVNAPSWNRSHCTGDYILFRPVLYFQLGVFYYFFKFNFFLWQAASLMLHILVTNGVYSLFKQGSLNKSCYPFLISALFGCAFIASELVLWSHISGYITFSLFFVYTILFMAKFLSTKKEYFGYISLAFGAVSQFTYELGLLVNIICSLTLFYCLRNKGEQLEKNKNIRNLALLFVIVSLLYPALSILDFSFVRSLPVPSNGVVSVSFSSFYLATIYSFKQLAFWIGGWFLPTVYLINAGGRTFFTGFNFSGIVFLFNFALITFFFYTLLLSLMRRGCGKFFRNRDRLFSVFSIIVFLFLYSFVIACGRSLPRGLDSVLSNNLYYSYIACLAVVAAVSVFLISADAITDKTVIKNTSENKKHECLPLSRYKSSLYAALVLLIILNSFYTHKLAASYRFVFSPPRLEVINLVLAWVNSQHNNNSYFTINKSCVGNDALIWFNKGHFRRSSNWYVEAPTIADVLFPERSFVLNKNRLPKDGYDVTEIKSPRMIASSHLNDFDASDLATANNPGWHAQTPVSYPQTIDVDFGYVRSFSSVHFLPQQNNASRAPRIINIKSSNDLEDWNEIYQGALDCSKRSDEWRSVDLVKSIKARFVRVSILANCGDPTYLTLRGLRFD